ncbi:hypothetical protein DL771_012395 [Monosporascus sp. 5C6A]|nr:hypothetical protein DL771_012395 [Monosporascus sp. 5C6A]
MARPGPAGQLLKVALAEMEHVNLTPWTGLPIDGIKAILHSEYVSPYVRTVSLSSRIWPSDAEALGEALPPGGICRPVVSMSYTFSPKVRGRVLLGSAFACSFRDSPWLVHGDNSPVRPGFPVSQFLSQDKARIATTFLGDAMVSPVRLVTGIFSVIRMRLETSEYVTNRQMDAPLAFASAILCRESADTLMLEDLTVVGLEGFLRATALDIDMGGLRSLEESLTELAKNFVDKGRLAWIGREQLVSTMTEEEVYSLLKIALSKAGEYDRLQSGLLSRPDRNLLRRASELIYRPTARTFTY